MVDVEKEMMKEIMADYHSGDPRKVASAKEQILSKAQRLITFMIKKYYPTYIPRYYDELYQECMVALYDAIPKFNPERATLSTYRQNHSTGQCPHTSTALLIAPIHTMANRWMM